MHRWSRPAPSCAGIAVSSPGNGRTPAEPARERLAERFVLTARTEVTDQLLIFSQRHLRAMLAEYEAITTGAAPHRSRQLHPQRADHPAADLSRERIERRPILGGLINEYERAA
jgi:hypothetical protein